VQPEDAVQPEDEDRPVSLDAFVSGLDYPMFVVTAVRPDTGERAGCLVGFTSQCSIEPDEFVVWLSHRNHTHRVASAAPVLAVHGLDAGQRDLAAHFGTRTGDREDKFAGREWTPGPHGVPILSGCRAWFAGRVRQRAAWGNHTGFLLVPVGAAAGTGEPPLMFSAVADLRAAHPA
jgi:flavin reductase (DIM6/NTAB) family NADH-FMN oxidoreductase RutF